MIKWRKKICWRIRFSDDVHLAQITATSWIGMCSYLSHICKINYMFHLFKQNVWCDYVWENTLYLILFIPEAWSCGGYTVFDPSVSPALSSWTFYFRRTYCVDAHILIQFYLWSHAIFELRKAKIKYTTESKQFLSQLFMKLCSW